MTEQLVALQLEAQVIVHRLNPKSVSIQNLFGEELQSGEWREGIASKAFKEAAGSEVESWVYFDGPIDALWIENLNTVLDDNKKLCLANSDIIKLNPKNKVIFEVDTLAHASLATVSRCGMIYIEDIVDYEDLFQSFLNDLPDVYFKRQHLDLLVLLKDHLFKKFLGIVQQIPRAYVNEFENPTASFIQFTALLKAFIFGNRKAINFYQDFEKLQLKI